MEAGAIRRRTGMARRVFLAALALGLVFAAPEARAQDQSTQSQSASTPSETPQTATDPNATGVGEVVVTARKREETIRNVPATITAVTAGQLAAVGPVTGTGDLLRTNPGVRFNDLAAPNLSEISIRGSGTERATGADSSVGLFVNGAYVGSSTLGGRNFKNVDFFDLERVEVLKGPQGALYGRNSEFGAVNIVLAKPEFKSSGYLDDTFIGGLDQNRATVVINQPLNDDFSIRLGAESYIQGGGFYKNPNTGSYYDNTDGWIVRGQLRYRHGPLDVNFLYDAQDLNLPVFVNSYVLPPDPAVTVLPRGYTADPYNIPHTGSDSTNQTVQRAILTIDYDLGWAKLTSTTLSTNSLSKQNYASAIDVSTEAMFQSLGEQGVYPLGQTSTNSKDNTLYEDFHGAGALLNGRVNWLAGAEVLSQRDNNGLVNVTSPCALAVGAGICGGQPGAQTCYQVLPTSKPCPAVYPLPFGTTQVTPQQYLSVAGYGSLHYDIGWGFGIGGELRYTSDDKRATQSAYRLYTVTPAAPNSGFEFQSDRTNYTVTLSYKLPLPSDWQQLLYAKTGTGYRAGGINPGISSPAAPNPFQPTYGDEDTTSYEAGLKGNLGRHIYFTIAGYSSRTTNAIASINDGCTLLNNCKQGPTVFNINGGTEAAHGVEASINGLFTVAGGRLSLELNGANEKADYVSVHGAYPGLPIVGSTVAQLPEYTASGTLDYDHEIVGDLDGFLNVSWNGQWGGGQDTVTAAAPLVKLFDFNLVSLRTGVNWGKTQLAFFVDNLTDEMFPVLQLQYAAGVPLSYRYNQPRTFGVDLVYRW